MSFPFAQPQRKELPPQLKAQMEPFVEYFEKKYLEVPVHTALPFVQKEDGSLPFEEHEKIFSVLPGEYLTATLAGDKRCIMLGTVLGTLAMYEVDHEVAVPVSFDPSGKFKVINYSLHAPEVFWKTGLLKLSQFGKVDLMTFVDAFGYPKKPEKENHNDLNLANRLKIMMDTMLSRMGQH